MLTLAELTVYSYLSLFYLSKAFCRFMAVNFFSVWVLFESFTLTTYHQRRDQEGALRL